ncbi:MAG: hypothetical protein AB8F94_08380 [Saprospiraceae bacterium]
MKNRKINIDQEVQKTMESIDQIQRVEGNPFLYTRLQEKLRQEAEGNVVTIRTRFPILQMAMVVGLLFINGFALTQSGYFGESTETASTSIDQFANEYALIVGEEEELEYLSLND